MKLFSDLRNRWEALCEWFRPPLFAKAGKKPWTGDMILRPCGSGERVSRPFHSSASCRVQWVSRATGESGEPLEIRKPREYTLWSSVLEPFEAADREYTDLTQLVSKMDPTGTWCLDRYGREVLYLRKRFPCFDSFDAMLEDRYYRWFFMREGNCLTRVYYADDDDRIYVTEDVEDLETCCWEAMERLGYFDGEERQPCIN